MIPATLPWAGTAIQLVSEAHSGGTVMELNISKREAQGVTILDLEGRIRLEGTNALWEHVERLTEAGKSNILLNMEKVKSVDSAGLGTMAKCLVLTQQNGGQLKLLNLRDKVLDLLVLTVLITKFEHYESEAKALDSFK
jgi:anti-sigma B factor antagonist